MDKLSERRLVENEVIFRESNKAAQEFIENELSVPSDTPLHFYCECSRPECKEHIELSADKYKQLHQNNRQFIVLTGHEITSIEKIIKKEDGFNLIEKYGEPPTAEELNLAVKHIDI